MAAAEYFSNAPLNQAPHHASSPYTHTNYTPQNYSPQPSSPYNQPGLAPPPYYEQKPSVHFAPSPVQIPQRHSFSNQSRPQFSVTPPQNNHQVNAHSNLAVQQRPPQAYGGSPQYGSPQQRPQYLTPHMRPYANPNSSQYSLDQGYSSDPESQRRRRHHRPRRESGESRSLKPSSRSTNADSFLGAAGGGLIGDLIFPGLGTIGGAALGWIGGRDYGKHRKDREEKRHAEQHEWEQKFRPHGRSSSHDHRSRRSSEDIGEYDPRESRGRQAGYR